MVLEPTPIWRERMVGDGPSRNRRGLLAEEHTEGADSFYYRQIW